MPNGYGHHDYGAIRPTLFIGLGGTGKEVLLRLRRKFYESFGMPGLPCVKYLWLDTDTRDVTARGEEMCGIHRQVRFGEEETVDLLRQDVGHDLGAVFRNPDRYAHIHNWLYPEVEQFGTQIADGAGNVRAVGRLSWMYRHREIEARILTQAHTSLDIQSIHETKRAFLQRGYATTPDFIESKQAVVVFSAAGGTGSGTFLDTAFLLRHSGQFNRVIGICVLPDVFFEESNSEVAERAYGNAYAALKELEYFTVRRFEPADWEDGGSCTAVYHVQWERGYDRCIQGPPFDLLSMLGRQNESGVGLQSRADFFRMVAESMHAEFMPGPLSTAVRHHRAVTGTVLANPAESTVTIGKTVLPQVFSRRYESFGLAKLGIPTEALRSACACQLAADIAQHWGRECKDADILRSVRNDPAERHLSLDGLAGRFVPNWKDEVRREVERVAGPLRAAGKKCTLDDVEAARTAALSLEDAYLGGSSTPDPERNLRFRFNMQGPAVLEEVKKQLLTWLEHCIEQPERGLRGLLMTEAGTGGRKGYLQVMAETVQAIFTGEHSELARRLVELRKVAREWKLQAEANFEQLGRALNDWRVGLLGHRGMTVSLLASRIVEAEQQYIIAAAESLLHDVCGQVAQVAVQFLDERTGELAEFARAIDSLPQPFLDQRHAHLRPEENSFFIQVYGEETDWPKFYKLGNVPVDPVVEARLMQGERTLYGLYEAWRECGLDNLSSGLHGYAEQRFIADFGNHPRDVDLLRHPMMHGRENIGRLVRRLVDAGLARVYLEDGRGRVRARRDAYVVIPGDDTEQGLVLKNELLTALAGRGYSPDSIAMLPAGSRGEVCLYSTVYGFPLASVPQVSRDCHDAYSRFYRESRSGQVSGRSYRIPLHIDKRWEGQFDDLVWLDDEDARKVKEAYEILLFGAMLGITFRRSDEGVVIFGFCRRRIGALTENPLGNRREATETLKNDRVLRRTLLDAVAEREVELTPNQLRAYVLVMHYLHQQEGHIHTVDGMLLEEREALMLERCAVQGVAIRDLPDDKLAPDQSWPWVSSEADGLLEMRPGGDVPVLAGLDPWVYEPGPPPAGDKDKEGGLDEE